MISKVKAFAFASPLLVFALLFAQDSPDSVLKPTKRFQKKVVISGLDGPWEVTWGPDNMLWVTERSGKRIVRVNPQTGEKKVAVTIDEVSAPGGQDGLQGMAIDKKAQYVYVAYTYQDKQRPADARVLVPTSPYRHLYGKIVRFTYDAKTETLGQPKMLVDGLPAGNDHNANRLKIGPDNKLYMTIGDQGNNQLGNFCNPIQSQRLPTQAEMSKKDFASYEGKSLRFNLDGSIPSDNPKLEGVVSHVWTYGHRNTQGIDFGPDGTLYAAEHGPKTDDEIDILVKGGNYGWPHVAGFRDNKAFQYAEWSKAKTPCSQLRFSDLKIHDDVPRHDETDYTTPFIEPIATLFTVPTGFNFQDPKCKGVDYICWPTVGISGVEYYGGYKNGIPGWDKVLLITTLKRGSLYILPLTPDGQKAAGKMSRYFQSENRFRDTAISPDGRTIYVVTDPSGLAESSTGGVTTNMADKGAILAFTYEGEGSPDVPTLTSSAAKPSATAKAEAWTGPQVPVQFTQQQVTDGKKLYDAHCAVCHGSTLKNGTFGTPLAGEYFDGKWHGRRLSAFFEKSKTMPPAAPASLPDDTYAKIVAYILEVNGFKANGAALPTAMDKLHDMPIETQR